MISNVYLTILCIMVPLFAGLAFGFIIGYSMAKNSNRNEERKI